MILEYIVAGMNGEPDYTVALMIVGDFFSLKEYIKDGMKFEQEVNRVTIPVPRNAWPAKFKNSKVINEQLHAMDGGEVVGMVKFMRFNGVDVS